MALGMSLPVSTWCLVSGPGARKTHWNLLVAAIAQAKAALPVETKSGKHRLRRARILYLIDVNKPVDDVADRMFCLCRTAGLDRKIFRMYGWPYELKHSRYIDAASLKGLDAAFNTASAEPDPDFTVQFLGAARKGQYSHNKSTSKAPTLDQAAWEHFCKHRDGEYTSLAKVLNKILEEDNQTQWGAQSLRGCVYRLYEDVLKEVDFIATAPVSAYGSFPQMFHPNIVFLDEAPHARELTSLIPIAFLSPIIRIFAGDFRQTRPFVASPNMSNDLDDIRLNLFGRQLTVSKWNVPLVSEHWALYQPSLLRKLGEAAIEVFLRRDDAIRDPA